MSISIGIRELKNQASEVVRAVREEGAAYVITHHGKPVAVLRPITDEDAALLAISEIQAELEAMQSLAGEIATAWTSEQGAVEWVEAQRR